MVDELGPIYGRIASVLKTHQAYVIPPVILADYLPEENDPDVSPFSPAQVAGLRAGALAARAKKVMEQAEANPKFYMDIFARIGADSRLLIRSEADYAAADAENDPNLLLAIVRRTHFTHVGGANDPARALEDLEEIFNKLVQKPNESVATFMTEWNEQLRTLASAGAAPIDPARLVIKFLRKLDQNRHGGMVAQLQNNRNAGGPFPQSVDAAYKLASEWQSSTRTADARGVSTGVAFMLADEMRAFIAPIERNAPPKKPYGYGPRQLPLRPPSQRHLAWRQLHPVERRM